LRLKRIYVHLKRITIMSLRIRIPPENRRVHSQDSRSRSWPNARINPIRSLRRHVPSAIPGMISGSSTSSPSWHTPGYGVSAVLRPSSAPQSEGTSVKLSWQRLSSTSHPLGHRGYACTVGLAGARTVARRASCSGNGTSGASTDDSGALCIRPHTLE
jgi:hypothetical protein